MMESFSLVEANIIKDIRNHFRLKKELSYTPIFRLGKETKAFKDKILRNIKNLFGHEEKKENYYKPVRGSSFWSNNHILGGP